ncbi:MAG TPA: hydroxymethylglutaryl-CoA lyase [Bacteroidia bacterium]
MNIKLVECPRDAMQGFNSFIPTEMKIKYLNALLKVGFYAIDCGSFVSSKAIPQLADTAEVLKSIEIGNSKSQLLVIVANERGVEHASEFDIVNTVGFPFSISEQFQKRNTNQSVAEAWEHLINIKQLADQSNKNLQVYLSMGFGNPYGDQWSVQLALDWCKKLADIGVKYINLSDTIGKAIDTDITKMFQLCLKELPEIEFGAHFHTRPDNYLKNITAAYNAGCRKFDSAMKGFGGCPFAEDKLTGNLPTESLISFLNSINVTTDIDRNAFDEAYLLSSVVFS